MSKPTGDLWPQLKTLLKPLLKLTIKKGLGKWPGEGKGWLNRVTAKKQRALRGWGVRGKGVSWSEEVSFKQPPPPRVHKCVPAAIVTLCYIGTEGLKQTGSKQCLAPFVSSLPFFCSPPSQSTGLLCIDFSHSATRQPLSAVLYALFCLSCIATTSPAEVSSGILFSVRMQRASWLDAAH